MERTICCVVARAETESGDEDDAHSVVSEEEPELE